MKGDGNEMMQTSNLSEPVEFGNDGIPRRTNQ